jgi:hypothetical protein
MKLASTIRWQETNTRRNGQLTIGVDLGDRVCFFCILNDTKEIA